MRETDVWKSASDVEFDNAMEGMEKLVMNRLYDVYEPSTLLYTYNPLLTYVSARLRPRWHVRTLHDQ
jgi:Domain of unknown function (DUF5601)